MPDLLTMLCDPRNKLLTTIDYSTVLEINTQLSWLMNDSLLYRGQCVLTDALGRKCPMALELFSS